MTETYEQGTSSRVEDRQEIGKGTTSRVAGRQPIGKGTASRVAGRQPIGKGTTSSRASYALSSKSALAAGGQRSSLKPGYVEQYLYSDAIPTNPRDTGFR